MEDEKETRTAALLGEYVDGCPAEVSSREWEEMRPEMETVNLLRLAFDQPAAPDELFIRRLRNELVEQAATARRTSSRRWYAVAAAVILLLLPAALFVIDALRPDVRLRISRQEKQRIVQMKRESAAAAFRDIAPAFEDASAGYEIAPFSGPSETRIETVALNRTERRMNAVLDHYMTGRGEL